MIIKGEFGYDRIADYFKVLHRQVPRRTEENL